MAAIPDYNRIASIAKHGTDEGLLAIRDEIRWLARWAETVHDNVLSTWGQSQVTIGPKRFDGDQMTTVRDVTATLAMGADELASLLDLIGDQ